MVDDEKTGLLISSLRLSGLFSRAGQPPNRECTPRAGRCRYVKYRAEVAKAQHSGRAGSVPITVRQLESLIRISEALARMTLTETATDAHVMQALALFDVATMDAVKSGLTEVTHDSGTLRAVPGGVGRGARGNARGEHAAL